MKLNTWIKSLIVTSVAVAIIFRVPQLKRIVTGS